MIDSMNFFSESLVWQVQNDLYRISSKRTEPFFADIQIEIMALTKHTMIAI